MRGRGPSPQEEARGKEEGADDHGRETGFGRCGAGSEAGAVGVECVECVEGGGEDDANGYGEEGEGGFALLTISLRVEVWREEGGGGEYLGPLALMLEGDRVGGEEEVEDTVCKTDVPGQRPCKYAMNL